MKLLSVSEMVNLEKYLMEHRIILLDDYKKFKPFEITYLKRAKRLPLESFTLAIESGDENNIDKHITIDYLSKRYKTNEKDIENRIKEVRKINKFMKNIQEKKLK